MLDLGFILKIRRLKAGMSEKGYVLITALSYRKIRLKRISDF